MIDTFSENEKVLFVDSHKTYKLIQRKKFESKLFQRIL